MYLIINRSFKKKNFFYIYIFIFWFFLWGAINTLPGEISSFGTSFVKSINALRILIPTIISIITFFFLIKLILFHIKNFKKYKFYKILHNSYFLFLTYFFLQIVGIYNNNFNTYNFQSLFLIYLGTGSICIFLLINYYNLEKCLKYLMFFTIWVIFIVAIYISLISFKISSLENSNYLYGMIRADTLFLNQEMPRITGLSRIWAIIGLFTLILFYNTNTKYLKYFIFIFISLLSTIIWAAQSRGTLLCYFLLIIFLTLLNKDKIYKKILFLFGFIFVPIIIYTIFISAINKPVNNINNLDKTNNFKNIIYNSRVIDNKTSSGRFEIWNNILNKFDKTRFFGYGPQADRNLIGRDISNKFSNNASNLYLYAFVCGGYLAIIIFLIINIQIIKNLYKCVVHKKLFLFKHNIEIKYSATLLSFFLIRGLIENSYSLFSIDFLLVIISLSVIKNYIRNKS